MSRPLFIGGTEDIVGGSRRWKCTECGGPAYIADPQTNRAIERHIEDNVPRADTFPRVICGRDSCVLAAALAGPS